MILIIILILDMMVLVSDFSKCISLNNESCLDKYILIDLNPNELHYYPFVLSLARYNESYNTLDDLSSRICVSNKTEDVNLNVFNMITRMSQNIKKNISCDCKSKLDSIKCNSNQKWTKSKCRCESKHPTKHSCMQRS